MCSAAACAARAIGCASRRSSWTPRTNFPVWSERYDREMQDVFEVQDEIARKIAEALRITLTPQEQAALAAKPTDNLQAYDLYLRGKSYARRWTRQDLEFARQMFENAVSLDGNFALAYAAIANVCALHHYLLRPRPGLDGTREDRGGAGHGARARVAGGVRRPGVGALCRRSLRRCDEHRASRPSRASRIARAGTTCSAARCSRPAAIRSWPIWRRSQLRRPAKTTTCSRRSRMRSARSARRRR